MKITECPRDAIQGYQHLVDTQTKIDYYNLLLRVGFDTLDFGSFVSPKAIPQMADTAEVVRQLDISDSVTKLLAIIANDKGASIAGEYPMIQLLGFPFSISETFQLQNTNKTIAESFEQIKKIQQIVTTNNQQLLVYISMGFGNPYNDPYSTDIVYEWIDKLKGVGIQHFSIADTLGMALPETITSVYKVLNTEFKDLQVGAHFHSFPNTWRMKIEAAYDAGCRQFDGAALGFGGCPLSGHELVGNIDTNNLMLFAKENNDTTSYNMEAWAEALQMANRIFST